MERAARRDVDQRRRQPSDRVQPLRSSSSSRGIERSRPQVYGWMRPVVDVVGLAVLDDLPRVHHLDVVAVLGHDAQVVGDDDDRRVELRPSAGRSGRGSAPARSRRARSSARRRSAGRGSARAPSRSSRAAACRRRTRAGTASRAPSGCGMFTLREHLDRLVERLLLRDVLVLADRLGDLVADPVVGVQRGHRVLEDHRDLGAADRRASRPSASSAGPGPGRGPRPDLGLLASRSAP